MQQRRRIVRLNSTKGAIKSKAMPHPILQGWLEKHKRSSSLLGTNRTKRWFTIESTKDQNQGSSTKITSNQHDDQEIILSYYKSPRASKSDRAGWIFLNDVILLKEYKEGDDVSNGDTSSTPNARNNRMDGIRKKLNRKEEWVICIKHPSRLFRIVAVDRYQHRLWFDTIKKYCGNAKFSGPANYDTLVKGGDSLQEIKSDQKSTPTSMKKLEPAGAIHKDVSEHKRRIRLLESDRNSKRENLQAELAFMRGMNGDQDSNAGSYEEDRVDTMPGGLGTNWSAESDVSSDEDDSYLSDSNCNGGKLVDDDEFIRYGKSGNTTTTSRGNSSLCNQSLCDNESNASIECGDVDGLTSVDGLTEKSRALPEDHEKRVASTTNGVGNSFHEVFEVNHNNTRSLGDHRLQQLISPNCGDETIQKRLVRAILSPSGENNGSNEYDRDDFENEGMASGTVMRKHLRNEGDLVTMVQEFSIDDSQDTSDVSDADLSADGNQQKIEGSNTGRHNSKAEEKGTSISFEIDCSFLPDEDFLTANWDSD